MRPPAGPCAAARHVVCAQTTSVGCRC
jgi:hypothetical protein